MALYRDKVAVLKSRDLGESDKILVLFGRDRGKFSAIAKGIRKLASRKRGHLETFSLVRVSCAEGKNLDIITEADSYFAIDTTEIDAREFDLIGFAGMMLDKFLPEAVPEPEIFDNWRSYVTGEIDEQGTFNFVAFVLDYLGFLSDARLQKLQAEDPKKSLAQMKKYVQKLLDTI